MMNNSSKTSETLPPSFNSPWDTSTVATQPQWHDAIIWGDGIST